MTSFVSHCEYDMLMSNFLPILWFLISFSAHAQQPISTPKDLVLSKEAYAIIKLEGPPDFLASDGDDVWVTNIDQVEKLSVKSAKPILSVRVVAPCGALITGFNSEWVASCKDKMVYRIDHTRGKIQAKIPTGVSDYLGEISLAIGAGSVWILSDSAGVLTRIDPQSNTIQAKISVRPHSFCAAFGYKSIWISNTNSNSVQRVDPFTNKVVATIPVGPTPRFLVAGENGIWTLNQGDGTVTRIDPQSNTVAATIDAHVPGTGGDIATGGGLVWVRAKSWLLQTINPVTNGIQSIYGPPSGSGAVRVTDHYAWISAHDINTIWVLKIKDP